MSVAHIALQLRLDGFACFALPLTLTRPASLGPTMRWERQTLAQGGSCDKDRDKPGMRLAC